MYLRSERVRDIERRYAVALNAVAAAEYREVFELPGPEDWGGDMTPNEWLDGFSTIDYYEALGPEPYENWVFGPEAEEARHVSEYRTGEAYQPARVHPPIWPEFIDNPKGG